MSEVIHKLVCRKGFGYVLVVQDVQEAMPQNLKRLGDFFICKTPDWSEMVRKVALAEELFGVQCEYENFKEGDEELLKKKVPYSTFEHPFFRKAPAMASLQHTNEPKPEHVRACLMELARYVITKVGDK